MSTKEKQEYIKELAQKENAVILAHYYVNNEIQEIADFLGDSLYLSQKAKYSDKDVILFCGVNFMAETAKILNPDKTVITPDNSATCSLAESVDIVDCINWKASYPNPYLITYINSTAELKAVSDIICTSANVLEIVKQAPKDATLLFAPDINMGNWINKTLKLNMKLWNGNCTVHQYYDEQALIQIQRNSPDSIVLAHPECPENILKYANFIGSTTSIINYAKQSTANKFIILTENGVMRSLKSDSPNKEFLFVPAVNIIGDNICVNMKKHTLDKIITALEKLSPHITIDNELRLKALAPLEKMLAIC